MGTITLPNNPGLIQNAQVTDATKVMENFTAIVSEVNGSLSAANLAALAVTAAKLAVDAVETAKIKDGNVTVAKIPVGFGFINIFDGNATEPVGVYNGSGDAKVQVKEAIDTMPTSGVLEIAGDEYAYTSLDTANKAFNLSGTLSKDYTEDDAVYIQTTIRNLALSGNTTTIGRYIAASISITLAINKRYIVSGNGNLTLPATGETVGSAIEIVSDGSPKIIQGNAEQVIVHKDRHFTTKGTSGFVQLFPKNKIELVYKGAGLSRIEPPVKLDALTAPEGNGNGCAFSYDGTYLAVAHNTSPYITVYKRTGDAFAKVSALTAPEGQAQGCAFSYDGTYLAVAHATSPCITVYKRTGDAFAKVSALVAPEGNGTGCAFSYDGTYLSVAHATSPCITVYKRTGDAFAKVSALVAPAGNGTGCAFSYDGTYLSVTHTSSPYITVYKRTGDAFAKVSALTAAGGQGQNCAFSYDGNYLAVAHLSGVHITVYKRAGDAFVKLDALVDPGSSGYNCAFSYDGTYLSVAHNTSPYITVYKRTGDAFAKISALTAPEGTGQGCAFSYDGTYLSVAHDISPYITVYKTKESANKVWIASEFETMNPADPSFV